MQKTLQFLNAVNGALVTPQNSKYDFIQNNILMAGMYGAPLQGNFPYAL
jgi:hypothetical protein